jgi:phenylalanyl-tRNA synthetase alpha chain
VSVDSSLSSIQALIDEALVVIGDADTSRDIEYARVRYLGKKGALTSQLKKVGNLPTSRRRAFGQAVNEAKRLLVQKVTERAERLEQLEHEAALTSGSVDVSLGGRRSGTGCIHPVSRTIRRIHSIFHGLGFEVAQGPEIEDDYHNFEALNIPSDHPARAMHDTFYVEPGIVLRTHTSPVQIRYLKSHPPPVQVIAPGRVYRRDSDVTHTPMFHQLEGLAVDRGVAFSDLKGVLVYFVREFFEQELRVRFRPSYFPFTEPSAEVDIGCVFCDGAGCRVCQQTGWLEILGCGMVHPNVLQQVGVNNEEYSGYAFGVGIERLTMLRYGVDDLRLFFENELGFLNQFR